VREENLRRHDGSLDRYFNRNGGSGSYRPPRERERYPRENTAYREDRRNTTYGGVDRYYRRDRYVRRHDDCLYDVVYVPVPFPVFEERIRTEVVTPPTTVVVPVPERAGGPEEQVEREEPAPRESPSRLLARAVTIDAVIADVEQAWLGEEIDLLMRHVRMDGPVEIYRDGEFQAALAPEEFRGKTEAAFARYETLGMRFDPPRMLSENEAVAGAEHRYRTEGKIRRARVVFALVREQGAWWLLGLDFLPAEDVGAQSLVRPAQILPVAPPALASLRRREERPHRPVVLDRVTLLAAPRLRWSALREQPRPLRIATLKVAAGGRTSLYDLKAMRGIHSGTLAWALYRRGQTSPLEVGLLEPAGLRPGAPVAVRLVPTAAPVARAAAAGGRAPARFRIRSLATVSLVELAETAPPRPARKGRTR
jgi:hypothetical protein